MAGRRYTNDAPFLATYAPTGDLMARLSVPANPSGPFQQVVEQAQTTQGAVVMQQSILTSQPVTGTPGPAVQVALRSWYSGDREGEQWGQTRLIADAKSSHANRV